ncbi:MAG: hypothetical protein JW763_02930 [candidate division Zixibacteria bacterium]|nr:hypothetical protein [candidate division Zixibacteria bacterium]
MKNGVAITAMALILFCAGPGCDNSTPTNNNTDDPDLSFLDGDWSGTVTILQTGACTFGGNDSVSTSVDMRWTVAKSGVTTIDDYLFTCEWSGTVSANLHVSFRKIVTWIKGESMSISSCPADTVVDTIYYSGTIMESDGTEYHLIMESEENWCPDNDCRFTVRYDISKDE